ncbi:ORF46 [Ranid herpesvirus 1]|uniref:ORF46 n=1 Tax=Ranid herpesvirus 1 TaxID=85655 RepID=Q14VR2_9VIRU|nr:ORF46 [Ranid herpesvirus 1]ABG25710.1 ORF46 [Ranid herpesvirus 1]
MVGGVTALMVALTYAHAAAAAFYDECFVLEQGVYTEDGTKRVALGAMVQDTRYAIPMVSKEEGHNSVKQQAGSNLCTHVCPDGTMATFLYIGQRLVCGLSVDVAGCASCSHYCAQHRTKDGMLTSKDVCYSSVSSNTITALSLFWTQYQSGTLDDRGKAVLQPSAGLSPGAIACLQSYVGLSMPPNTGDCVMNMGNLCLGDYCISRDAHGRGYTDRRIDEELMGTVRDVIPIVSCRLAINHRLSAQLSICDECVIEYLDLGKQRVSYPFIASPYCKRYIAALTPASMESGTAAEVATLAVRYLLTNNESVTGLEFPTGIKHTQRLSDVLKYVHHDMALQPGVWSVDVRVSLLSAEQVRQYVTELETEPKTSYNGARYVWIDAPNSPSLTVNHMTAPQEAAVAVAMYRRSLTYGIIVPAAANTEEYRVLRTLHQGFRLPLGVAPALQTRRNITGSHHGMLNVTGSGRVSYHYYVGDGPMINCQYVQLYAGPAQFYTNYPYNNTIEVPYINMFRVRNGFTCARGSPAAPRRCAGDAPSQALSVISQQTESTLNGGVYYDTTNDCYWGPTGPRLCTFASVSRVARQELYLTNGAVTNELQDMGTHYLATMGFYKIITGFTDVVELLSVDQACGTVSLNDIPSCLEMVCGDDETCKGAQQSDVCSMDRVVRESIQGLINEFEYSKARYRSTVSVVELWRLTSDMRPRRFIAEAMAGAAIVMSAAAFATAYVALNRADRALQVGQEAKEMGLRNLQATAKLGVDVSTMRSAMGDLNARVGGLSDTVFQMGNTLVKLGATMQNNIDAVNGRISALEASVNQRLLQVAAYVNTLAEQTNNAIARQARAAIYYQQLNALSNQIITSNSKLMGQITMFSTCLNSIHAGRLFGCPITNRFLQDNPDYNMVTSVYGAAYDGAFLSIMFKIPDYAEPLALYSILVKPILMNDRPHVVDTTNVVVGPDNTFYLKPSCEGRYCAGLDLHPTFGRCFSRLQSNDSAGVAEACILLPCQQKDCGDRLRITSAVGEKYLKGEPHGSYSFQSSNFFGGNQSASAPQLTLVDYISSANSTEAEGVLTAFHKDLLDWKMRDTNASEAVVELLTRVGGYEGIESLLQEAMTFYHGSGAYSIGGTSITTILLITLCCLIVAGIVLWYCIRKRKRKDTPGGTPMVMVQPTPAPIFPSTQGYQKLPAREW